MNEDDPSPASAVPVTTKTPPPDLGILLVHGIGNHKQGETLNDFAAPIVKWIDRWLVHDINVERLAGSLARHVPTKDYVGTAEFKVGTLRPPDLPLDTPAHARAKISAKADGRPEIAQSWLFAESWWSPQTLVPRVSPFLLWLITRGPWLMLLHLKQRFDVDYRTLSAEAQESRPAGAMPLGLYWRLFKFAAITGVWLLLSLVLIMLWCVVSLIALVPIGYVRKQVYAVLIEITGVVGDSYVLINDPIQRVAFAHSARQALEWLRRQGCTKLAVVAHSQGAAVARDVLMATGAPQVDLLVTLGPGIAKLHALSERERLAPQTFLWAGAAAPLTFLMVASFLRLNADGETGFALWAFPAFIGVLAAVAIFVSWHYVTESWEGLKPNALQVLEMGQWQRKMVWRDFYASHDPVSNGPLSATIGANWRRIASRKVMVLASLLGDHTAYWTSRADFVPRVVAALDRCAGTGLFPTWGGLRRVARGSAVYRHAVRLLWAQRWLATAALLIPLVAYSRLRSVAGDLHDALDRTPIESVGSTLEGVDTTFGSIGSLFAGHEVNGEGVTALLLLAAIAAVVVHVWGRIVFYWWQHMASTMLTPVFTPSANSWPGRLGRWLLLALVATLGALPPVLSIAWTFFPESVSWESLRRFIGMFVTLACMVAFVFMMFGLFAMTREFASSFAAARKAQPTLRLALKEVPDLWYVPVSWLLYAGGGGYLLSQNRYTPDLLAPAAALVAIGGVVFALNRWRSRRRRSRSASATAAS